MSASARLTLSDLAALKRQIDHERREAAQRQQREKEARQKAERERRLFKLSVGDITPLHDAGKVLLQPPPPEPVPRQRELDEQAAAASGPSSRKSIFTACAAMKRASPFRPSFGFRAAWSTAAFGWCMARGWARPARRQC